MSHARLLPLRLRLNVAAAMAGFTVPATVATVVTVAAAVTVSPVTVAAAAMAGFTVLATVATVATVAAAVTVSPVTAAVAATVMADFTGPATAAMAAAAVTDPLVGAAGAAAMDMAAVARGTTMATEVMFCRTCLDIMDRVTRTQPTPRVIDITG